MTNYRIHAEARMTVSGTSYLVKDFENANMRKIEVYDLTVWASEGLERFVGYADDLGILGALAAFALGRFEVDTTRRASDDGIDGVRSLSFEAQIAPHGGSDGGLDVWVYPHNDLANPVLEFGHFGSIDSVRAYLGELEIGRFGGSVHFEG